MNSNGNTTDRPGTPHKLRAWRPACGPHEFDGTITVIADRYNGKRLNSPNDVVVASNGTIWFTDPTYGIGGFYEGLVSEPEQEKHNVYRVDPQTGTVTVVVDDFVQPNGICFSPDERRLYVIDSGITHGGPAHIRSFDVDIDKGTVSNGKVFAEGFAPGFTDGIRCDVDGNVWCSMGWADPKEDGVRCYTPARRAYRQNSSAGDLCEPRLRRPIAQPLVHVRKHVGLRRLCKRSRCGCSLIFEGATSTFTINARAARAPRTCRQPVGSNPVQHQPQRRRAAAQRCPVAALGHSVILPATPASRFRIASVATTEF